MSIEERVVEAYTEYRNALFRYLVHTGLPAYAAQEVTHDCFLRLHAKLLDGEEIRHTRAWLFTVAHNAGINWLAENRTDARAIPEEPLIAGPDQALLEAERLELLRRAIDKLSEQQKRCLHLRAEGLRYREIGEVLGIETSTAAEFIRRAIAQLRKALYE